jgi:hypothetical protein
MEGWTTVGSVAYLGLWLEMGIELLMVSRGSMGTAVRRRTGMVMGSVMSYGLEMDLKGLMSTEE